MTTASSSFTGQAAAAASEPDLAHPTRKAPGGVGRRSAWYRRLTPYLFLLIPVGLLLLLTYTPVVNMFWYSVTDWDGLDKTKNFIGIDNYVEVFTDPDNLRVFYVSLFYVVGSFVQMALALYFATILSFKMRFKNMWKGILFFPYLINGVAIGLIFLNFLKPGGGLDTVLMNTGLESLIHQWTGDPDIANFSLAAVSVWRYTGPDVRDVPGRDPVHQLGDLRGGRTRRREPLAGVLVASSCRRSGPSWVWPSSSASPARCPSSRSRSS